MDAPVHRERWYAAALVVLGAVLLIGGDRPADHHDPRPRRRRRPRVGRLLRPLGVRILPPRDRMPVSTVRAFTRRARQLGQRLRDGLGVRRHLLGGARLFDQLPEGIDIHAGTLLPGATAVLDRFGSGSTASLGEAEAGQASRGPGEGPDWK